MNLNVKGDFKLTIALKQYVEEKIYDRLGAFSDYIDTITVKLSSINKNNDLFKIEVLLFMKGRKNKRVNKTSATSEDMYEAIDLVADKCFRMIKRHKEILLNKKEQKLVENTYTEDTYIDDSILFDVNNIPEIEVVKIKEFDIKPMFIEEAIIQMEQLGHSFFVYLDAETSKLSVIYKRKDNKYALIETNK